MKSALMMATAISLISAATAYGQEPVILKFWDNQQTESGLSQFQQAAVDRFESENPGITVEVTTIPYPEFQQRLLTAVQGGNAPDISTLDQIWVAAFAKAGAISDLTKMASDSDISRDAFFPGAWDSADYNGKLYGIPFNVDAWSFTYVNKALFAKAGIDPSSIMSWDGLKLAAEKLTDPANGQFGLGLFGHKGEDTVVVTDSFIFSNGGSVLNSDGSCGLNSPASVEALNYLASLVPYAPNGILNASSGDMRELFLNGSLAMEFWPALEQPTLQKSDLNWDFVAGQAPEGKTAIGTYGGWNLAIYKTSPNKEAAWKFIEFMTREDVNGDVVDLVPANIKAAKTFLEKNRLGAERIMKYLDNAKARPLSPVYLEVSDAEMAMMQDIYSGMPAQEAADKACKVIDAL
ncbi:MAG: sugar ABC transporter substrate-binding protein [Alphaproteobacteria bacterium]|nr:sugar ABC transporter substrate-binding protein [Alphaproteobacteria bacterium]